MGYKRIRLEHKRKPKRKGAVRNKPYRRERYRKHHDEEDRR